MKKPNLLFVFSDQHRKCSLGCYGNEDVKTPNFDNFAKKSMVFDNCISNSPVCVPMRGGILSGLYPWNHKAITNDLPVDHKVKSIGNWLSDDGYHTGYIGKWHLAGIPRNQAIPVEKRMGFTEWKVAECNHIYNHGDYYDEDNIYHKMKKFQSIEESDLAIEFLERNSQKEQPWALFLSWSTPHSPFNAIPENLQDLYDKNKLSLLPNVPESMREDAKDWYKGYYSLITLIDTEFGKILSCLDKLNLTDDTIIVYTSDHGDLLGSHNLRHKQLPYEESINVPLMISWQNHLKPMVKKDMIGLMDLPVTLASLMNIKYPKVDGNDCKNILLNSDVIDEFSNAQLICDLVPCHQAYERGGCEWIGVRTQRYTYAKYSNNKSYLLFDNFSDQYQMNNLANRPEYAHIENKLNQIIDEKLSQANYNFRPWEQMIKEDGFLEEWNRSQRHFNLPEL